MECEWRSPVIGEAQEESKTPNRVLNKIQSSECYSVHIATVAGIPLFLPSSWHFFYHVVKCSLEAQFQFELFRSALVSILTVCIAPNFGKV